MWMYHLRASSLLAAAKSIVTSWAVRLNPYFQCSLSLNISIRASGNLNMASGKGSSER